MAAIESKAQVVPPARFGAAIVAAAAATVARGGSDDESSSGNSDDDGNVGDGDEDEPMGNTRRGAAKGEAGGRGGDSHVRKGGSSLPAEELVYFCGKAYSHRRFSDVDVR